MGIDRIGKGGGVPTPTGPNETTGTAKTGKAFEVEKPDAATSAQATQAASATGSAALEQLKAGKIDFDHYVDMKVTEATSHLEGVSPAQLETIRSMLRERMATDPELADLVKQATGHSVTPPED